MALSRDFRAADPASFLFESFPANLFGLRKCSIRSFESFVCSTDGVVHSFDSFVRFVRQNAGSHGVFVSFVRFVRSIGDVSIVRSSRSFVPFFLGF